MMISEAEYQRALDLLPAFQVASKEYRVPVHILMGIASRESRMGLALDNEGKGDFGHGHSLMQIDDRSHGKWLRENDWRDPFVAIGYGAKVLRDSINYARMKGVADEVACGIAGYNCGPARAVRGLLDYGDPDHYTTGKDYSRDVLTRAKWYLERLENEAEKERHIEGLKRMEPLPPESL